MLSQEGGACPRGFIDINQLSFMYPAIGLAGDGTIFNGSLPDNPKLRNRMNLPGGSAPVVRIARRRILRFLRMSHVKIQPPFKFTPMIQQLFP